MSFVTIYDVARIYYPILAAVGIPVNLTAIVILSRGKCGLSNCITRYLVGMAVADLTVVVVAVIGQDINNLYSYASFLHITPVCALTLMLKVASFDCSVWLTVVFTFDRYVAICCQNLRKRYCTERVATAVIVIVVVVGFVRCIPFYFMLKPHVIINNVPWRCVFTPEYFTSPVWKAYELFDSIKTPLLPFCLILLCNVLTGRHIIVANRVRKGLRCNNENQKDPEVENRRKSIILLFALSGNFILLWMSYIIHSMNWQAVNFSFTDKHMNTPIFIFQECGIMLMSLSTCTNTCIYGLTQKKFREELKTGMKYVLTLNGMLFK